MTTVTETTTDVPDTERCHTWHSRRYLRHNRPDQPDQMPAACACCDETEESAVSLISKHLNPHQPISFCAHCGYPWPCLAERSREKAARASREALEAALVANLQADTTAGGAL